MWRVWRPVFGWKSLCPVLFADPFGFVVVMARAAQPVTHEEVNALPDYYPDTTSETKIEDQDLVDERRAYYVRMAKEYGQTRCNL
jgi:hypothetical protein